jgi:hypothetical protein
MNNEKKTMCKKDKNKTCVDCLHCKVCANSTEGCKLCFCAEKEKKEIHFESYWLKKKACRKFEDMTA